MAYPKRRKKAAGRVYVNDLTGQTFGRLYVIARAPSPNKHARWWCACECGRWYVAYGTALTATNDKRVVSCGCWRIERMELIGGELAAKRKKIGRPRADA